MSSTSKNNDLNIVTVFLTVIGLIFLWTIVSRIIADFKKNTSSDVISEEGKKILNDPEQRDNLRKAVEYYHKTGSWDELDKVSS